MTRLALLLGAASLLAGCAGSLATDHPRSSLPHTPAATGRFQSAANGPFSPEPVPGAWWRLYRDDRLDALVTEALAANTDLRVAAANIERARALLAETADARRAQVSLSGGASLSRPEGTGADLPGQVGYDAGIGISYELDIVGRLRHLIEAAEADTEAAQAAYDLTRITVAANVVGAYVDACAAGEEKETAERSLALQEESLALTRELFQRGRGTALDITRAETLVEQLRAPIPAFEAARQNALYRLAVLLGRPPAEFPKELAECRTPPRLNSLLPVGDGAALIRRRPDIRAAERTLAAAGARVGVAVADLYPRVQLGGSAGLTGLAADLGEGRAFRISLGPLISWTFPNQAAARARIKAAEATEKAALARFDGTVLTALREVEVALNTYARELERHAALEAARDRAATAATQAEQLQRLGRGTSLSVLDAQRTLASAEAALAASTAQLASEQVALFLALGGGWETGVQAQGQAQAQGAGQPGA